jgi:hypothetical protein
MVSNWGYCCLAVLVFCGGTVNWLHGSAVMVSSWQMLCSGGSATVVVELISCRWLKYIYFVVQLESPGLKRCYCIEKYLFRTRGSTE